MQKLLLLKIGMHGERALARHGIIHGPEPGLVWYFLNDRLEAILSLLIVNAHLWGDGSSRKLLLMDHINAVEVQALKLLGCSSNIKKLLLELLLALSEVQVCGHELGVVVRIHIATVLISHVEGWWRKNLFRMTVDVLLTVPNIIMI